MVSSSRSEVRRGVAQLVIDRCTVPPLPFYSLSSLFFLFLSFCSLSLFSLGWVLD